MADDQTPSEGLTGSLFDRIKGFFTSMWTTFWETSPDVLNPFFSAAAIYLPKFGDKASIFTDHWQVIDRLTYPRK